MSASNANDHEQAAPTSKDPWTATLCWARGQNSGAVSVFPNRAPVYAVVGRLVSGETFAEVAADFDVPQEALHVLWQLRLDLLEAEGA